MIIETERLILRKMDNGDYSALCKILQDEDVMYAYEHAFSDDEVDEWLKKQLVRYETDGIGLWAVVLKENGEVIGQCGLTKQLWWGENVVELGYLFRKDFWHKGYATEAAVACKDYAFNRLGEKRVYSIIRDLNLPSRRVALRNGMKVCGVQVKHYYGIDMPHLIYCVSNEDTEKLIGT